MEELYGNIVHSIDNLNGDIIDSKKKEYDDISDRNALTKDICQNIPVINYNHGVNSLVAVRAKELNSKTAFWIGKVHSTSSSARRVVSSLCVHWNEYCSNNTAVMGLHGTLYKNVCKGNWDAPGRIRYRPTR